MMRRTAMLLSWLLACGIFLPLTTSYPILCEVPEETQRCFTFNIPKDDDAHMVFVALPPKISWELEDWVMSQIKDMTKRRQADGSLPLKFALSEPEDDALKKQYLEWFNDESSLKSSLTLRVQHKQQRTSPIREEELLWYRPVVLNHIVQSQRQWEAMVGGYSICFDNAYEEDYVHVGFEMVLVSEEAAEDDDVAGAARTTKEHLTPLQEQLTESIHAAHTILKEMRFMEKREARMRITAESIFSKIRLFSYLSVVILLVVTLLQVRYLKGYFKKKKLM